MTPEDTIAKLENTWSSLAAVCRELSDPEWEAATACPGWSVKDHVSHLIGFERVLNGRPAADHVAPEAAWVRNAIGAANENEVDARRSLPGGEVLAEFEEVTAARLEQLRALPEEAWTAESWTPIGPGTVLDLLQIRVLDSWVHEQDVRRAVGRPGNQTGPAAEHTVDRLARTLAATFGKRAGAPEGASLDVRITGPVERSVFLRMESGRAQRLDAPPENPTVALAMASTTFVSLATGRTTPDGALAVGEVEQRGDEALGRAVLDNLNQMI
jgi:uncharacterized protein (TIGR03083 family)